MENNNSVGFDATLLDYGYDFGTEFSKPNSRCKVEKFAVEFLSCLLMVIPMRAYIMRHAEANDTSPDPLRELTMRGREEAKKVAKMINAIMGTHKIPRIISSSFVRARQTAQIVQTELKISATPEQWEGLTPSDECDPIKRQLQMAEEDLLIVGHNPQLSFLTASLLTGSEYGMGIDFQKAGCVCLERYDPINKKADLSPSWVLCWYVHP